MLIDMMNASFDGWDIEARQRLVLSTNDLVRGLRRAGAPVIWVKQEFAEDMHDAFLEMRDKGIHKYARGTPGCKLVAELDVHPSDEVLVKKRYSAFFGTDLDARLLHHAPSHLVLAGVNTHACVRTTAIDAYQRDWRVLLAADCIASYDDEHHRVSMKYMSGKIGATLSNAEILRILPC
jgi:nicotinamidase-related amidase